MRANEFITEALSEDMQKARTIVNDCRQFFQASGPRRPLFRGQTSHNLLNIVRKDRTPKDTPYGIHRLIDGYMRDNFGIGFRSEAMFCTGKKRVTEQYGTTFMVFPMGNFDYCWSPRIKDMFEDLMMNDLHDYSADNNHDAEDILDSLKSADYRCNVSMEDFRQAIDSGHEIIINCEKYYALAWNSPIISLIGMVLSEEGLA